MAFSLSDYAGPLAWLGASVAVHAGLAVGIYKGRVDAAGRFQRAMGLLASLLCMRGGMSITKVFSFARGRAHLLVSLLRSFLLWICGCRLVQR